MATEVIHIIDPDGGAGYDYLSLADWYTAQQRDLVSLDEIEIAKCRSSSGSADTTAVNFGNYTFTTDATRRVIVRADSGHEAGTQWDTAKYRLQTSNKAIESRIFGVTFDHIQITSASNQVINVYNEYDGINLEIIGCLVKGNTTSYEAMLSLRSFVAGSVKVVNTIVYDAPGTSTYGIYAGNTTSGLTYYYYNCTVHNCSRAYRGQGNNTIAKNCIAQDCGDGFYSDFNTSESTNNLSNTNDAPGSNPINSTAVVFVDEANDDFGLDSTDSVAKDAGVNLSADSNYSFNVDIAGNTRSGSWDIGASEYVSASTPVTINAGNVSINETPQTFGISAGANIAAGYTGQDITPQAKTVNAGASIEPGVLSANIATQNAAIAGAASFADNPRALNIAAQAPQVSASGVVNFNAPSLSFVFVPADAEIKQGSVLNIGQLSQVITPQDKTIAAGADISPDEQVLNINAQSAQESAAALYNDLAKLFNIAAQAPQVSASGVVTINPQNTNLSAIPQAAALSVGHNISVNFVPLDLVPQIKTFTGASLVNADAPVITFGADSKEVFAGSLVTPGGLVVNLLADHAQIVAGGSVLLNVNYSDLLYSPVGASVFTNTTKADYNFVYFKNRSFAYKMPVKSFLKFIDNHFKQE